MIHFKVGRLGIYLICLTIWISVCLRDEVGGLPYMPKIRLDVLYRESYVCIICKCTHDILQILEIVQT